MHEFDLINNYFFKIAKKNKFALNLNDDVFFDKKRGVVISIDTYNIGTHFYDFKSPDLVIKKILRSSISDLICKGVKPKFYFISGSGNKKTFTKNNLYKISKSLKSEHNKFNIDLFNQTFGEMKNKQSKKQNQIIKYEDPVPTNINKETNYTELGRGQIDNFSNSIGNSNSSLMYTDLKQSLQHNTLINVDKVKALASSLWYPLLFVAKY